MIIRAVDPGDVIALYERCHAYKGAPAVAAYTFAVIEDDAVVAAFSWMPPPYGAALSVCPEEPGGVLALSRMVAVPRTERRLKKISKAIRRQRDHLIDRGRWPVLITYSDEGVINERGTATTGNSYRYSGFTPTKRRRAPQYERDGRRTSSYSGGATSIKGLTRIGSATIQRWEHWACPRGEVRAWMARAGWRRVEVPGRWKSGAQAHGWAWAPTVEVAT